MSRIEAKFKQLTNQKALITYITAGDPNLSVSLELMHTMVANGVDILEIGFPFSEPMADGVVIQRAIERSLANQVTLEKVLELIAQFRQSDQTTPVILMGYLNPVYRMGYETFAKQAHESGVDGVLIVDCPVEYIGELNQHLHENEMESIFLITPTTPMERVKMISTKAGGFLYYVSLKGVTGSAKLDTEEVRCKIEQIRPEINIPIVVGFGVKDFASAHAVAQVADGVVVGSRIIQEIEKWNDGSKEAIIDLVKKLKQATYY